MSSDTTRPGRSQSGTRFARVDGWVWRWSSGTVLALGPGGDRRRLGGAAGAVWAALERPSLPDEIRRVLRGDGDSTDVARSAGTGQWPGVDEVLAELVGAGLVVPLDVHGSGGIGA